MQRLIKQKSYNIQHRVLSLVLGSLYMGTDDKMQTQTVTPSSGLLEHWHKMKLR